MSNRLGKHFKSVRLDHGFSLGELARLAGYRNACKGSNRISRFEQDGTIKENLLMKLAEALSIEWLTVEELIEQDRRQFLKEWNEWANEPIKPHVVVRLLAAVYWRHELSEGISSVEEAEDAGSAVARKWKRRCCLTLSRRISVWFDEQGFVESRTEAAPGLPNEPFMKLGRRNKTFLLKTIDRETTIQQVSWPAKPMVQRDQQSTDD